MPGKARQPRRPPARSDPWAQNRQRGVNLVRHHPLFAPLADGAVWRADTDDDLCPSDGWAVVTSRGYVVLNPRRRGEPEEWSWVAAHCLLHLGFGHLAQHRLAGWRAATGLPSGGRVRADGFDAAWNLAACVTVNRFLSHLKVGRPPEGLGGPTDYDHLAGGADSEGPFAERLRSLETPPVPGRGGDRGAGR